MRRSTSVIWFVLAAAVVVLVLLVDPAGWFAGEGEREASALSPGDAAEREPERLAEPLPAGIETTREASADPATREALDPLAMEHAATLRVLHWRGDPAEDVQVLVVRGEELLIDARTDRDGEVTLDADGAPAGVVLALEGRPPQWLDVVLVEGRQDLHLEEGAHLAGRFETEDGRSPGSLHLTLESDHPPTSHPDLPAVVTENLRAWTLRRSHATFDTDEEGAFDLTGLPHDWSGAIWMRGGWKVVAASSGAVAPGARGIRFTAPKADVVVCLAPAPVIRGRLVRGSDGGPLDRAQLLVVLRYASAVDTRFNNVPATDDEGRFEVECRREERPAEIELRLGRRYGKGLLLRRWVGAEVPVDGDLGDVVVDAVRHVPFLLQELSGTPIAGGRCFAAGIRSERTGRDGRGELRWVPETTTELLAEARGFVPTSWPIPQVVALPLVVSLPRANELRVKLLLPEGSDPTQFKVLLEGEERITAEPMTELSDHLRHLDSKGIHLYDYSGEPPERYLCSNVDENTATATFYALRPGVELQLEVQGITGNTAYFSESVAPLGAEEHRELEIPLDTGMVVFRGRVVDAEGRPLARAVAQLGGQILGWADEEGRFECFLAEPKTGTLLIQHIACTTLYLHDYAVPTDGREVEFRLEPARPLTVEVVDEHGTPMPQADVYTEYGGFTTNTNRIEGNRFLSQSMPAGPFVIRTLLAGRVYRQDHDPSEPTARVVVPVHARVVVHVDAASTAGRKGRFVVVLDPAGGDPASPVSAGRESEPELHIELPAVLPGAYEAVLHYHPSDDEAAAGQEEIESERVTITVTEGVTELHLALPADG